MPRDYARCPFCSEWLTIDGTIGFAYARIRMRLHFAACIAVGSNVATSDLDDLADRLAKDAAAATSARAW